MIVICKYYDTCEDRIGCYHSTPHELTSGWRGLNTHYNCNGNYWCTKGECVTSIIRKLKIKKLNGKR